MHPLKALSSGSPIEKELLQRLCLLATLVKTSLSALREAQGLAPLDPRRKSAHGHASDAPSNKLINTLSSRLRLARSSKLVAQCVFSRRIPRKPCLPECHVRSSALRLCCCRGSLLRSNQCHSSNVSCTPQHAALVLERLPLLWPPVQATMPCIRHDIFSHPACTVHRPEANGTDNKEAPIRHHHRRHFHSDIKRGKCSGEQLSSQFDHMASS
mmetsp:Transcript_98871/g.156411  ORF Transcript_98871/g.156411 Transcript_98871/m.156411 type:complete len:213 (+) Transcript_98871:1946-2584(+)